MMFFPFPLAYFAPFLSFALALLLLTVMLRGGWAGFALDHPNQRSLHAAPVPRTGGLALMAGAASGWLLLPSWLWPALAIAGMLLAISLWDDVRGLPVKWRLLAHVAGAAGFVHLTGFAGWAGALLAIPAIIWMTNLYNFMDGSDGLAGGMALFGFGGYGTLAWLGGDTTFALACFAISGAAGAFLVFNFHPARIFMGDAGSIPLGFLAAALGILGWQRGLWPLWVPLLVFSPFIVDASVTLAKRLLRGEKIWQAHREHYYQRLVQMGWGHRRTALAEYALMAVAGASAIWAIGRDGRTQWAFGIVWGLAYLLAMWMVDAKWSRRQRQSGC